MTRLDALGNDEEQTVRKVEEIIFVCNMCAWEHSNNVDEWIEYTKSGNEKNNVWSEGQPSQIHDRAVCIQTQTQSFFH